MTGIGVFASYPAGTWMRYIRVVCPFEIAGSAVIVTSALVSGCTSVGFPQPADAVGRSYDAAVGTGVAVVRCWACDVAGAAHPPSARHTTASSMANARGSHSPQLE